MAEPSRRRTAASRGIASPEEYSAFIQQVELETIWLVDARITNQAGPLGPDRAKVGVDRSPHWEPRDGGFRAFDRYEVVLGGETERSARIEVTFGLDYRSAQPMTNALFGPFGEINLPLNTWPYAREFVSTTMGRMNWLPLTLPALKRHAHAVRSAEAVVPRPASGARSRARAEPATKQSARSHPTSRAVSKPTAR